VPDISGGSQDRRRYAVASIVSPISRALGNELLNRFEAAGLDSNLAQKVIDSKDNDLASKVVGLIEAGGFEAIDKSLTSLNPEWLRARELMGKNFFGVEEAMAVWRAGSTPSAQELASLVKTPFSEEELARSKDTHILVADMGLSIVEMKAIVKDKGRLFFDQDWYHTQEFAKETAKITWHLVRKTPIPNSISKSWAEQQALISPAEEMPNARLMVLAVISHFLATGERLFERTYARCSDVASDDVHVNVGLFDSDGLHVHSHWAEFRGELIGASSAWKSERNLELSGSGLTIQKAGKTP
jgi:hypothetical protein